MPRSAPGAGQNAGLMRMHAEPDSGAPAGRAAPGAPAKPSAVREAQGRPPASAGCARPHPAHCGRHRSPEPVPGVRCRRLVRNRMYQLTVEQALADAARFGVGRTLELCSRRVRGPGDSAPGEVRTPRCRGLRDGGTRRGGARPGAARRREAGSDGPGLLGGPRRRARLGGRGHRGRTRLGPDAAGLLENPGVQGGGALGRRHRRSGPRVGPEPGERGRGGSGLALGRRRRPPMRTCPAPDEERQAELAAAVGPDAIFREETLEFRTRGRRYARRRHPSRLPVDYLGSPGDRPVCVAGSWSGGGTAWPPDRYRYGLPGPQHERGG